MFTALRMIEYKKAYPKYPIPEISPAPIAKNRMPISFAVPGTERNLTRLNAPATATPVPTLPLTIMMTTHTTAGRRANVTTKLLVYLVLYMYIAENISPIISEHPIHNKKSGTEITFVISVSKIPLNIVSSI